MMHKEPHSSDDFLLSLALASGAKELLEDAEWLEALDYIIRTQEPERVQSLLQKLQRRASLFGIPAAYAANTPYLNTIAVKDQKPFPGDTQLEWNIRALMRWNALAMVQRANHSPSKLGGHISTYASCAHILEIAFNHFFRGKAAACGGDLVYFQGHSAPGIYARAFLEGRLSVEQLENFRRELGKEPGLPSYPHPYCMPDFWEFPTVSMGLSPIMAIYQARFYRYLQDRGFLKNPEEAKVWAFIGDGESDEPETLGAISLAARENLDNLIFVINCNLQRLDGPVRGNHKIIQELESNFRGAGWNVIKAIWGSSWDNLLAKDELGLLAARMEESIDGEYQKYSTADGSYIRKHFFGKDPRLLQLVESYSDADLARLKRGGHDTEKIYAAYHAAMQHRGSPTVILFKTVKGYALGASGEARNITHQKKHLSDQELLDFRDRFAIPISDKDATQASFYKPKADTNETRYLKKRREQLGGFVPTRIDRATALPPPDSGIFEEFYQGSSEHALSTTMVFIRLLTKLLRDPKIGRYIVPIVPDEARTFGMETLFSQVGIYSHVGQKYEPVDRGTLVYYKEDRGGQILEEGITEAGAMSSFIAAGTSYANYGINMIAFFIYYSMFGFQRVGDLIWAAGDMGTRGFLIGGTAGKTSLSGEGLQHQDGHSQLLAYPYPHVSAYDPAFAFEIAAIIEHGIRKIYTEQNNLIYYLTVCNENYCMPPPPQHLERKQLKRQIIQGMYLYQASKLLSGIGAHGKSKSSKASPKTPVHILSSASLVLEAIRAAEILENDFGVPTYIWSVTSYKQLFLDLRKCLRQGRLTPEQTQIPYVTQCLRQHAPCDAVLAVSDYSSALALTIAEGIPFPFTVLGTDGFGRSDTRAALRDYFEVNAYHIVLALLSLLYKQGKLNRESYQGFRDSSYRPTDEDRAEYKWKKTNTDTQDSLLS